MKFRKRPVEVGAFQMTRERRASNADWPGWLHDAWNKRPDEVGALFPYNTDESDGTDELCIFTLEGTQLVSWGDWIIRGGDGFEASH